MQFFNFKDYAKSWSTWVLSAVAVTPVLSDNVQSIASLLPEAWKPYFVSALGVIGLIVRAIKQK
jgi:hypothetical protein|uniref:Holin n=1 Tax=Podoviridae sp. ctUS21 TaxID=2826557 RepID=A0A8S5MQP2_9CAUD|nr:MAG TPA: hypothetical protein [Podoviridae sp. ctUS21]DAR79930.1 MAG TPA: hypothetical protein [Caudoviricetes sp.]DAV86519.1 MAG TPA: hypothetical protein [Caudoviricetes sp.]